MTGKSTSISEEDIRRRWDEAAAALPQEKRQAFLDLMWNEGASVHEARTQLMISFEAAMGIMNQNIEKREVFTMRREAK